MHILLPLLMHPIYEASSKDDENNAISTIGVLAGRLPLGKYQRLLWSTLLQINRQPSRERHLISLICILIDAFHFEIDHSLWDQITHFKACNLVATPHKARSE